MKKIKFLSIFLIFGLILCFGPKAEAQEVLESETAAEQDVVSSETSSSEISEELMLDENVTAEDLHVSDQTLLPTNPYYQIKNIWRNIKSVLTFNPVKKAELKLQYANEKLIEVKKMAETEDNPEAVVKALKNYQKEINQLTQTVENFSNEIKENSIALVEKMINNSFKQQKLIDRIEKGLSADQLGQINQVRNETLEQLGKTIIDIIPPEQIQERIETVLQNQTGSEFKDLKNLGVLKIVEQKLPEKAAEAVQEVQKNILEKLEIKINSFQEQDKEKFQNYVENLGGNVTAQLQIIEDISENGLPEEVGQKLEEIKVKIMEKAEKMQQEQIQIANPASENCVKMGGQVEIKTDENGGQSGICHLSDGSDCEEWTLFRGECPGQQSEEKIQEREETQTRNEKLSPEEGNKIREESQIREEKNPQNTEMPPVKRVNQPAEQQKPVQSVSPLDRTSSPCIQVITPAMKDGICKEFPTPCDVPDDWTKVNVCPTTNSNVQMEKPAVNPGNTETSSVKQNQVEKSVPVQSQVKKTESTNKTTLKK